MNSIADIVRNVKRNAKTMDGEFSGMFALPGESLERYTGTLENVAFAHAVLRLRRDGLVCPLCSSDAFTSLKSAILDVPDNKRSDQPTNNGGNQDERENQNSDTGDKRG